MLRWFFVLLILNVSFLMAAPNQMKCQVSVSDDSFGAFVLSKTNLQTNPAFRVDPVEGRELKGVTSSEGMESSVNIDLKGGYRLVFDGERRLGGIGLSIFVDRGNGKLPLFNGELLLNSTYIFGDLRDVLKTLDIRCNTF